MNLPNDRDAEKALLGAVLVRPSVFQTIDVDPEDFYVPAHATIWAAMVGLFDKGEPPDAFTVNAEMVRSGSESRSGGLDYLAQLQADVPTAENASFYARKVRAAARLRSVIVTCSEVSKKAYSYRGDTEEFLAEVEAAVYAVTTPGIRRGRSLREVVREVYDDIVNRNQSGGFSGIQCGMPDLDRRTMGWQRGNLILLASRPSVGKTTLGVQWSIVAARSGSPVIVFSLEQSDTEVGERSLASEGRLDASSLKVGRLNLTGWETLLQTMSTLGELPVEIDDSPGLSLRQVRSRARRFASRFGDQRGLVVIDYLQLVKPDGKHGNREQEVASVSRGLKALAKELRWTVIALAQLKRKPNEDEEPLLSDLRESGSLEQDSDLVIFLHRNRARNITDAILAKNRNGPVGRAPLVFVPQNVRFESAAEDRWDEETS
ncbi:MAG: replicative DNA helicase [Candidatus Eisenbacteria bacterium]